MRELQLLPGQTLSSEVRFVSAMCRFGAAAFGDRWTKSPARDCYPFFIPDDEVDVFCDYDVDVWTGSKRMRKFSVRSTGVETAHFRKFQAMHVEIPSPAPLHPVRSRAAGYQHVVNAESCFPSMTGEGASKLLGVPEQVMKYVLRGECLFLSLSPYVSKILSEKEFPVPADEALQAEDLIAARRGLPQ